MNIVYQQRRENRYVALCGEKLVGEARIPPGGNFISYLLVHPRYRGRGIAAGLIGFAVAQRGAPLARAVGQSAEAKALSLTLPREWFGEGP